MSDRKHARTQILQLCKVSSVSVHLFRRSCINKTFEQTDGLTDTVSPLYTKKTCLRRGVTKYDFT